MTLEQIKKEIYYYTGTKPTNEEAEEIEAMKEDNPSATLCEIIADYYSC